jgi:hypothetical protein
MEFEEDDVLRCLHCGHAEHAECLDQWLAINKSCPICLSEVVDVPSDKNAPLLCSPVEPTPVRDATATARTPPTDGAMSTSAPLADCTPTNVPVLSTTSPMSCATGA